MANYPDWVLKYKSKGYYVNKYKDHYRLYKGHCEYKDGKYIIEQHFVSGYNYQII